MDRDTTFKEALKENSDRIYRICCCYFNDEDNRKDAYQEVLIHIWESLHTFEGRSMISTWIYRITVNTCLSLILKEKRRKNIIIPDSGEEIESFPCHNQDEKGNDLDVQIKILYESINQLPVTERSLISLYLEDLSTKEMAEVLAISEANVRVKLHRIKKTLKKLMQRSGYGN